MLFSKLYWSIKNKLTAHKSVWLGVGLIMATISIIFLVDQSQKTQSLSTYADNATAELTIEPSSGSYKGNFLVKIWANTSDPMAFARVELSFDPSKVQLVNNLEIGNSPLTRTIILTDKDQANQTGQITLTAGLDPKVQNPNLPDNFALANLRFQVVKGATGETKIEFRSGTSLVDLTATDYDLVTQGSTFTVDGVAEGNSEPEQLAEASPTPSPDPSITPESSPDPESSSNPAASTEPTPTTPTTPSPTTEPTSQPTTSPEVIDDSTPDDVVITDDSPVELPDPETATTTQDGLSIKITSPANNASLSARSRINVTTEVQQAAGSSGIKYVRFYINGHLRFRDSRPEYRFAFMPWHTWSRNNSYRLTAVVIDKEGRQARDTVTISYQNSPFWYHWFRR